MRANNESPEDRENDYWRGRTVVLATKHKKEDIIRPLIEPALGVSIIVPPTFDSDLFGTFTGEVKRLPDQRDAARAKARAALTETGETVALASEGSFAPDPHLPFLTRATELVLLIDTKHNLEIMGVHVSHAVQPQRRAVTTVAEGIELATSWGFPTHGVIVRVHTGIDKTLFKELTDVTTLEATLKAVCHQPNTQVTLETDLRAHRCPARHALIAAATKDLIKNATARCPACHKPGFNIIATIPGLPCGQCGHPTDHTRDYVYRCTHCHHTETKEEPVATADPGTCSYCNP